MGKSVAKVTVIQSVNIPRRLRRAFLGRSGAASRALRVAGEYAVQKAREAAGASAQSKNALRSQGYPYAKRAPIKVGNLPQPFKARPFMIGKSTGQVQSSIVGKHVNQWSYRVIWEPKAEHVKYVVEGTRVMHGRDLIRRTMSTPSMLQQLQITFFSRVY